MPNEAALAPEFLAILDRLAMLLLKFSPADRAVKQRLIFVEVLKDFRSQYPALPDHELTSATFRFMRVLQDRVTKMVAYGGDGVGGHA